MEILDNLPSTHRLDDLQYKGLKLLQMPDEYCFTSDAVILSSIVRATANQTVVDFGCGNGVVAILVSAKTNASKVYGLEIQKSASELAKTNVQINSLQEKIEIICGDIANSSKFFGSESIDIVVCNPPYYKKESGQQRLTPQVALARHENTCNLNDIIANASRILKFGGKLFMIHKVQRMAEVLTACSNNKIQPKKVTLIYPKANKPADTFIVEAKKGAQSGMEIQSIIVYNEDNSMTQQAKVLYNK